MSLVIGIDSSTQSTKAELRRLDGGELVARGSAPHPPATPPSSEQDPEAWWGALVDAVTQLGPERADATAISVAGQQHGLVLVDDEGRPVRPAKLWNDTTSAENASALVEARGAEGWAMACGSVPVAAFTVTKLAWVAANEPAALDRAARVMLPHDYLTWRLSGRHVTDRGDASGTGWYDPTTGRYQPSLLAHAVDDAEGWLARLPIVLGPDEAAGSLTSAAAAELGLGLGLGLGDGVTVGPGTGDNMAAALGLGLGSGDVALSLGTSGTVYAVSPVGTADATGAVAGFADAGGRFLPLVCTLNATVVTDTVASWLGTDAAGLAALAVEAGSGPTGVITVPYFDGERTPNLPDAAGSFHGLRRTTTRPELARAAHDGVLCGLLDGLDALRTAGVAADGRLLVIGGGARSAAYRQRCADLSGAPVTIPDADEAVATGAAAQAAAVVAGRPVGEVAADWQLGAGPIVEPRADADPEVRAQYHHARRSLYPEA